MRKYIIGLTVLISIVYSCANPGYPTGGPKDETPPKISKSEPVNGAMNFKKDEVIIEFDEIIKLNEVNQKLVVSPPLKNRPKVTARAQKLSIQFDEELQENTTYTLDFADAVEDNNEGNPLSSFVFSFSTGEVVDSFALMGNLWDATDLTPIEGAMVMVHKNLNDTAFTHDVPVRLAKSDKEGFFAIRNLSPGEYRIYAIEDANRNYMFDQPGERIAWFDTIVSPSMKYVPMPDTLDNDSVMFHDELVYYPNDIKMFMFEEKPTQQYFLGEERKDSIQMSFTFNLPVEDFTIKPVDYPDIEDWAILEPSVKNDTIKVWITDSAVYKNDTLNVALSYLGQDTLNNPVMINDTLTMYYFNMSPKKSRKKKKNEKVKVKTLKLGRTVSQLDLNRNFNIEVPTPIKTIDQDGLKLYEMVDTLMTAVDYTFTQDSLNKRRYSLSRIWTPGARYVFVADSASIEDVYGLKCDSIGIQFSVKTIDSYGVMLISITDPGTNWLVQLLNSSGKVIRKKYVPESGKFGFQYLKPGKYNLKLVIDDNKNGEWDPGKYEDKLQPEQIIYFPDELNVRANWDVTVPWNPHEFDIYDFVSKNRKEKKKGK